MALGWLSLGLLIVAVWLLYELLRFFVIDTVRRLQERRVDRFLREHEIPDDAFRHTHRLVVKERVLADARLNGLMAARAAHDGVPFPAVQAKVRAWLDEIVPQFNILLYYRLGYRIARLFSYSVYHVRLDKASLAAARAKVPPGASVVFISNHRSNADFVVTGFMISKSVQVSYAVGEWARVWPLERLFKSFGSYFVRRGEKDPLYHETLQTYVRLITDEGVTQAVFPEGGLSRDGALRPFKVGLLDAMLRGRTPDSRPLVFIPVGINFDRVFEDEILVRETVDGDHPLRRRTSMQKLRRLGSLLGRTAVGLPVNLARFATKRVKKHGVCAIHFGEPLAVTKPDPDWDLDDRHARWRSLQPLADELRRRVAAVVPVTAVTLVCRAARRVGRPLVDGVDRGTMLIALRKEVDLLRDAGVVFATGDPYRTRGREASGVGHPGRRQEVAEVSLGIADTDDLERILVQATDVLHRRRLLYEEGGRTFVQADKWPLVEYYANAVTASDATRPVPEAGQG